MFDATTGQYVNEDRLAAIAAGTAAPNPAASSGMTAAALLSAAATAKSSAAASGTIKTGGTAPV